jgi:dimethylaniline monooxygenase (N-oxide forming)
MGARVAVLGAGPLGLIATKILREDGFEVTAFESRPYVGGLWKYFEDEALSAAESTIFNTSKYRSAISDFPFPLDTDDFPTWQQMHSYLESYCVAFGLRECIHLNSPPVTRLSRAGNEWAVQISLPDSMARVEYFDKVIVASGTFAKAKKPELPDIELFKGSTVHSLSFYQPAQYACQNVLITGLHATAQDKAVGLSKYANKLYISHRHGVLLVSL